MGGLGDSKFDKSKDSKFCRKQFTFLHNNPAVLFQKGIKLIHECRIKLQERTVEGLVEVLKLRLILLPGDSLLEFVQIARSHGQIQSEVFFLGSICLHQFQICSAQGLFCQDNGLV